MSSNILYNNGYKTQKPTEKSESKSINSISVSNIFGGRTKPLGSKSLDTESKKYTYLTAKNSLSELAKKFNDTEFKIATIGSDETQKSLSETLSAIHKTLGIAEGNPQSLFTKYTKYYNRFKLPTLDDKLQKGFAHVFFVRPDLNLLDSDGGLTKNISNNPEFSYAYRNSPSMIKELVGNNGSGHDFMLSLSNKAASFSLSDEFIDTDTYGRTFAGWKIAYGKRNVESKTAGDFSITYQDDRTLHVYHLHKLWVDYIAGCFHGSLNPKEKYILKHVLDYATSCYYIVTAEDNETIIFWSKYYGVFPSTIPSTQYSWAYGNTLQETNIEIKYQYSFKEDFNPMALVELNTNSKIEDSSFNYVKTYNESMGHVDAAWVGVPFVELIIDKDTETPFTFKLRFKEP